MQEQKTEAKWYALKVHMGFENAVADSLTQTVESLKLKDTVQKIIVPTEKQTKIKGGKRTEKEEKIYPGFVLIKMIEDENAIKVINSAERVTGFVGNAGHMETISEEEIEAIFDRMDGDNVKHDIEFEKGNSVRIIDGPLSDIDGKIEEIDVDKGQVTVLVSMFGRETPVKLDIFQIRRI